MSEAAELLKRKLGLVVTDLINIRNKIKTIQDRKVLRDYAETIASLSSEIYWLIDDAPIKPEVTDGEED